MFSFAIGQRVVVGCGERGVVIQRYRYYDAGGGLVNAYRVVPLQGDVVDEGSYNEYGRPIRKMKLPVVAYVLGEWELVADHEWEADQPVAGDTNEQREQRETNEAFEEAGVGDGERREGVKAGLMRGLVVVEASSLAEALAKLAGR